MFLEGKTSENDGLLLDWIDKTLESHNFMLFFILLCQRYQHFIQPGLKLVGFCFGKEMIVLNFHFRSYNLSMYRTREFHPSDFHLTDSKASNSDLCFRTPIQPKALVMASSGKEQLSKMPNIGNFVPFFLLRVRKQIEFSFHE